VILTRLGILSTTAGLNSSTQTLVHIAADRAETDTAASFLVQICRQPHGQLCALEPLGPYMKGGSENG
jgi:hypothetical protein